MNGFNAPSCPLVPYLGRAILELVPHNESTWKQATALPAHLRLLPRLPPHPHLNPTNTTNTTQTGTQTHALLPCTPPPPPYTHTHITLNHPTLKPHHRPLHARRQIVPTGLCRITQGDIYINTWLLPWMVGPTSTAFSPPIGQSNDVRPRQSIHDLHYDTLFATILSTLGTSCGVGVAGSASGVQATTPHHRS